MSKGRSTTLAGTTIRLCSVIYAVKKPPVFTRLSASRDGIEPESVNACVRVESRPDATGMTRRRLKIR
jgi:hypothetical protein